MTALDKLVADHGRKTLCDLFGISAPALTKFTKQGYLPPLRAQQASARYGVLFVDLVKPELAAAINGSN